MNVAEINDRNIDEMILKEGTAVIDCYASWCGPCKLLSRIIAEMAEESDSVSFYKIDTEDNPKTVRKYNIKSVPTLLIFKNGELKKRTVGFKTKEEIMELL